MNDRRRPRSSSKSSAEGTPPTGNGESTAPAQPTAAELDRFQHERIPGRLPAIVLLNTAVFPSDVASIQIDRPRSVRLLEQNPEPNLLVGCFFPAGEGTEASSDPGIEEEGVLDVGVACRIVHRMRMPNDTVLAVFQGIRRIRKTGVVATDPYLLYDVEPVPLGEPPPRKVEARIKRCLTLVEELVREDPGYSSELVPMLRLNLGGAGRFADLLGIHLRLSVPERRRMAATADPEERLEIAEGLLEQSLERRRTMVEVSREARAVVDRQAEETLLRAELAAIRRRLGTDGHSDVEDLGSRLRSASLPLLARAAGEDELRRLARTSPGAAEYGAIRAWLTFLLELPWGVRGAKPVDLETALQVLDRDHFGLQEPKERILEVLAVLDSSAVTPVLCFAGAPGTGKTSLGHALARAAGRAFARISVAGEDDEAAIEGTPRNHPDAMPGRILQELRRCGVGDPVFMIDDVDRMARDGGADPAAALTEALDPDVRDAFVDLYLDVPYDLTPVFFVATANVVFDVPVPLRERLEVIHFPGYTPEEKYEIARRHLAPRARARTGSPTDLAFTDEALRAIVLGHTREAGVRHLGRMFLRIYRKVALWRATGRAVPSRIDEETVLYLLGPPAYERDVLAREASIGIATGLAWTADGGVVQLIEVLSMPGSGRIVVTGRLGDVMRESADIAYSWVRAHGKDLGIDEGEVRNLDLHAHAPEGGVRKDGPSAGVVLATAIVSVLTKRPIRPEVAMTGELTLRGEVLGVGGIREKVAAAQRAGLPLVLLPLANRKDVEQLGPDLKRGIEFRFLDRFDGYLEAALLPR